MPLAYRGAALGSGAPDDPALVRALQKDLRRLGYLRRGIDGVFGDGTRRAVRQLQFDLLHNNGESSGRDGPAAAPLTAFNRGVTAVTGVVDAALADSIAAALASPDIVWLPESDNPAAANHAALAAVARCASAVAPAPFLLAIFRQESQGQHYAEPSRAQDADSYVTVGLDCDPATPDRVTSRGYGLGQYTLFHHPPRPQEVADVILDPVRNVQQAFSTLRDKFDRFVAGTGPGTRADDRSAEHPLLALRLCRYRPGDPRYMTACQGCAKLAAKVDIGPDTPLHHGTSQTYGQARHYPHPRYQGVPDRAAFLCDWPYAVRRYNGSGPDSYNYQARVLLNLLAGTPAASGPRT